MYVCFSSTGRLIHVLMLTGRYVDRQKISDIFGFLMTEKESYKHILNAAEMPTF